MRFVRYHWSILLVFLCTPPSARSAEQPFEITISASPVVTSGSDLKLSIVVTNISRKELRLTKANPDCDYILSIVDEKNHAVALADNDYARDMSNKNLCRSSALRNMLIVLKPGESAPAEYIFVNNLYDIRRLGTRMIQVQRLPPMIFRIPGSPHNSADDINWTAVRSNQIFVTVTD